MAKRKIVLCYRKIIDVNSNKPWEKLVFNDSYMEFRMQVQNFAEVQTYPSYGELLSHVPEVKKLNHIVSGAVMNYIQQLNEVMPDILNNLGRRFLKFKTFQFEIINSHLHLKDKHQVSISFFSEPVLWYDTIDNYLLIGNEIPAESVVLTHLFQLQPYLSIYSVQMID
ncbi:hypothetical protein GCM10023149_44020 [Mucilaginibacter gynuensis]|uniref:Uncharacterized protein n=1 Tax=Mucilaginibacter gynuensis TaxID=1302236 RepID=A0ABP8H8L7_9SPHI